MNNTRYVFHPMKEFGGTFLKRSHPKVARPLSRRQGMHFVFRSSLAFGQKSFHQRHIKKEIWRVIKNYKAKIKFYYIDIQSNHIHLIVLSKDKKILFSFLRAFSGLIARKCLCAEKGMPAKEANVFWDFRPYSRIIKLVKGYKLSEDILIGFHLLITGIIPNNNYFKVGIDSG